MSTADTWTKIKRIAKSGFFNFWRNSTVSLASVLVMMVTLSAIALILLSGAILDTSLSALRDKIDVNVTFVPSATESEVLEIKQTLESLPEVLLVTYVSRGEALETFKERHANDQSILAALDELGENPLGAVLNVKARNPSQYASVASFLKGDGTLSEKGVSIIDRVNYYENKTAIDRLSHIIDSADKLDLGLSVTLSVISMLIAFNTIRLTIYMAKDEIAVMRLVGASTTYIQGPFVVVGVIYGVVAGLITLLLFLPLTYWFGGATRDFFEGFSVFSYYVRNLFEMAVVVMVSGVLIGAFSSILAIRRYLKI